MNEIPYHLYAGAQIDTGGWYPEIPGDRIFLCEENDQFLKVGIYYPTQKNFTAMQAHLFPKADCKLILRSLDDDFTDEERKELEKMGLSISHPRQYIHDEHGDHIHIRIHLAAELIAYLIKQKFSLGLFSKEHYIIKPYHRD